jgi:hypothetical protein
MLRSCAFVHQLTLVVISELSARMTLACRPLDRKRDLTLCISFLKLSKFLASASGWDEATRKLPAFFLDTVHPQLLLTVIPLLYYFGSTPSKMLADFEGRNFTAQSDGLNESIEVPAYFSCCMPWWIGTSRSLPTELILYAAPSSLRPCTLQLGENSWQNPYRV